MLRGGCKGRDTEGHAPMTAVAKPAVAKMAAEMIPPLQLAEQHVNNPATVTSTVAHHAPKP